MPFVDGESTVDAAWLNSVDDRIGDLESDVDTHLATQNVPTHALAWVLYRIDAAGALDLIEDGFRVGPGSIDTTNPAEHIITFNINETIGNNGPSGPIAVSRSTLAGVGGSIALPCSDGVELNSGTDEVYAKVKFFDATGAARAPNGGYVSVIAFSRAG